MAVFKFEKTKIPDGISPQEWMDWSWQLRYSLKSATDFAANFNLSDEERIGFDQGEKIFNFRATPYYASLAKDLPEDPIRKILMPHALEIWAGKQQMLDPLGEKKNNPTPRIIHRYSDRVLFLITDV